MGDLLDAPLADPKMNDRPPGEHAQTDAASSSRWGLKSNISASSELGWAVGHVPEKRGHVVQNARCLWDVVVPTT